MALHIIKLAVGIEDPEDLGPRQERWKNANGNYQHRTRMTPTRATEVLAGGSMYWVIKGMIQVRQPIVGIHAKKDDSGKPYCIIELEPRHIPVAATAKRPFQGWRYLKDTDAPPDAAKFAAAAYVDPAMPKALQVELRKLGLL